MSDSPSRILVITDQTDSDPELHELIRARAQRGPVTVQILATNPARAEFHVFHPERHDQLVQALAALEPSIAALRADTGAEVHGAVSIRHDPFEAVEELLLEQPADEIVVAATSHELSRRLHHDLPHRLAHLHLPVTVLDRVATVP